MVSKRKFSDFHAEASGQDGGRERNSGHHAFKKAKNTKKINVKPDNVNWLKKRVRTIERRFKTGHNMPATVQNELERELAHHKQKIDEVTDEKKRKSMISKYHMVRFFERKKADRLAKQIRTQLETAEDPKEIEKLNADLHRAEIDSIYTRFFPYRERYISLYPVASLGKSANEKKIEDASIAAQALHGERPPLWETIEKASEEGTSALIKIRERKSATDSAEKRSKDQGPVVSTKSKDSKAKKHSDIANSTNTRQGKGRTRRETNDDSDSEGGFFEEE
ncbi:hypothetical protein M426DRAFT_7712 [Hypoxylon sp. CI-4A]|nr:hypothetical protein M426DRAFT_7712 [Hypoxylon sp. CI-4A]